MPILKSPRKTPAAVVCGAILAICCFALQTLHAQEPPAAPVPKQAASGASAPAAETQGPQNPAPPVPTDSRAKIVLTVNLVILPVTVKDSSGHLVPDLTKEEFRILDDNIEQRITAFTIEAFPLSAVVLIDNDLKGKDAQLVESSLKSIVAGLSLADEAFVCRFDTNFHEGKGFTKDQDKLLTELKRTRLDAESAVASPGGPFTSGPVINGQSVSGGPAIAGSTQAIGNRSSKALDDAIYSAAQLLADRGRDKRKMIFLISDGQNSKYNKYNYETVIKELLRYNISVYSLAVGGGFLDRKFSRLQSYAHDTGGDVYYAVKRKTLEELYSRVTEQARNQYTLAYAPQGNDRGKDYHSVEVRVRREGLNIITREGYYSSPPLPK